MREMKTLKPVTFMELSETLTGEGSHGKETR